MNLSLRCVNTGGFALSYRSYRSYPKATIADSNYFYVN